MLYHTTASNTYGIAGQLNLSDHTPLQTKHPLADGDGLNPEQLIASAWATCLNATIQALLETQDKPLASKVDVTVSLCKEIEEPGYYFDVKAEASIDQLPLTEAQDLINQAHARCPISKLLQGAKTLHLETVPYGM